MRKCMVKNRAKLHGILIFMVRSVHSVVLVVRYFSVLYFKIFKWFERFCLPVLTCAMHFSMRTLYTVMFAICEAKTMKIKQAHFFFFFCISWWLTLALVCCRSAAHPPNWQSAKAGKINFTVAVSSLWWRGMANIVCVYNAEN